MSQIDEGKARAATLALVAARAGSATVCPSEIARSLTDAAMGDDWRLAMPAAHAAVDGLLREGAIRLSWKGQPLAARAGPYRIAAPGDKYGPT